MLEEAITGYLAGEADREWRRKTILSLAGSVSPEDGDDLRRIAGELRESSR